MISEAEEPDLKGDRAEGENPPSGRLALLRPLAVRDFRLLWAGESISLLGDQFYLVALPWLTLQLTGSGLILGTVMMTAAVPRAVFMLLGGALTDRFSPRVLMLFSNMVRALLVALIGTLIFVGAIELWHLYLTAALFGLVDAFFFPAFTTLIPRLLAEERLAAGNSLVQGSAQLSTLIGPAPAGVLIASVGIAPAFVFDAITFIFSASMLWLIRSGNHPASALQIVEIAEAGPPKSASLLDSIRAGLGYAWRDEVTRAILFMIAAINFSLVGPFFVGLASLADRRFEGGAVAYGTMLSAWGGGALLGTLLAGSIGKPRRRGLLFISMSVGLGIGAILIGFMPNHIGASVVIAFMGLGSGFTNVGMVAWLQMRTTPQMLGRVMSVVMLAGVGLSPFSFALAGALVDVDATFMFAAAGALVLLSAAIAAMSRTVRSID
ncbi:MAG: MFS transporter [Blastocatellia bacterium]|nr:MFS transporter [Blastocatellia bacterium]